jgi:hypothetical protein
LLGEPCADEKRSRARSPGRRASWQSLKQKRFLLMMMVAALRIVEDPGADNDSRAHRHERNKPCQHSKHDNLPCILFLSATIVSVAAPPVCIGARRFAITFSRMNRN